MTYTDPFGGSTLQAAQVAYNAVSMIGSVTLSWPAVATNNNFLARLMDLESFDPGYLLTFPSALNTSVGWDALLSNLGAVNITVKKADGSTLCTIAPGQVQYVYLYDNTTAAGLWRVTQFASLTSAATAASLVGPGIAASGAQLYNALVTTAFSVDYTLVSADRTRVFAWTGGVGTLNLLAASSATSDFFVSVTNQGTGLLTLDPNSTELIDGDSSLALSLGESCVLHCDGSTGWYTVGLGRSVLFNFTVLTKTINSGTYTLSISEASNVVQKYVGVLAGNVNVVLPSTVQVYYVSNQTSGAFSVTFKTAGVGATVTVPTNQNAVLFCDGTNVINASTTVSGIASLTLNQGSVSTPSINYTGDTTTGMYQPAAGSIAWALIGVQKLLLSATGLTVANGATFGGAVTGITDLTTTGNTILGNAQGDTLNVAAGAIAVNAAGSVTIAAPSSGYALTASGVIQSNRAGVDGVLVLGPAVNENYILGSTTLGIALLTANLQRLTVNNTGNVTIAAPSSGVPLAITGPASTYGITLTDGTRSSFWYQGAKVSFGNVSNHALSFFTKNLERVDISAEGNVTIAAPSSGITLGLVGAAATNQQLLGGSGTTTGAQSAIFTNVGGVLRFGIESSAGGAIFGAAEAYASVFGTGTATAIQLFTTDVLRLTIGTAGNVTIAAPSSGAALEVYKPPGSGVSILSQGPLSVQGGFTALPAVLVSTQTFETPTSRFYIGDGTGYSYRFAKRVASVTTDLLTIADSGNVTINAPSSGTALTLSGVAGGTLLNAVGASTAYGILKAAAGSLAALSICGNNRTERTTSFDLQQDDASNVDIVNRSNTRMSFYTNGVERLQISAVGNVTIAAPAGGVGLTVSGGGANVTGTVAATTFSGAGTSLTGTASGLSIGGAAPAGSLTGATLAAGVTASSLTSVGTVNNLRVAGAAAVGLIVTGASANLALQVQGGDGGYVYVNNSGQLYGTALHNNAGAVTGTANQYVASGTYTPTLTAVSNCTSPSALVSQWTRVGNVVTVSGRLFLSATVSLTNTELGISLPIASALTVAEQCAGTAMSDNGYIGITADPTNDRARMSGATLSSGANNLNYHFTYLVA